MGREVKRNYRGLLRDLTAAGSVRWRVRVEGQENRKIRIAVGPGESGFEDHYAAARRGLKLDQENPAPRAMRGSLDELCGKFLDWMEDQVGAGNLSPLTLSSRRTGLTQACDVLDPDGDRLGSLDADLPRETFVHIRDSFGSRTGAAATCLKALRAAYTWGKDRGYPQNSAIFGVKPEHREKGGAAPWKAEDVEKFLERYGPGTMARLWFCLAYSTRSRIGDAPTLGPVNEAWHDGVRYIEWQPRKKGSAFVSIPMEDMLAAELEHHLDRETYLATDYGKPFASSGSLDNRVRKWLIGAGFVEKVLDAKGKPVLNEKGKPKMKATRSQHGIRKGVAELMAERGATEYELMAAFGWTEAKTAGVYTRKFHRRGAAAAASKRLSGGADLE
jgi:integrase